MNSPTPLSNEAVATDLPSRSLHTLPLDGVSTVTTESLTPSPLLLLLPSAHDENLTVRSATSDTATVMPPPAPASAKNIPLLSTNSLQSLFSKNMPSNFLGARRPTCSEQASGIVSRGSYLKCEGESQVDDLLLEATQAFRGSFHIRESVVEAAPAADVAEVAKEEPVGTAKAAMDPLADDGGNSKTSPLMQRMRPQSLSRTPFQLEMSAKINTSEGVECVESYDPHLRKIVTYNVMSSFSLDSPYTAPSAEEIRSNTTLCPGTLAHSRCSSLPPPVCSLSGSPMATNVSAQTAFGNDCGLPHSLMRFPVFNGLSDAVWSPNSRYNRRSTSILSCGRSKSGTPTTQESAAAVTLPVIPRNCPTSASHKKAGAVMNNRWREKNGVQGSMLMDSPAHLSEGISGFLPTLSPLTSLSAMATTGALFSSEEIVAPSRSCSRSLGEGRVTSRRHRSTAHRKHGGSNSESEILIVPNVLPAGVDAAISLT
ncbi:hypothetical protein ABL78_0538 [Leptomonas seymouri]|uniref:Uncharacterized protein n=1 Tax=Leptomonas seymouri TaxID=5684 RepID=A0A0N1IMG9_LEPSE|nr:hypothetical protein ABL78_0538 [Leptomonas seymouri]|eukprot:KPI90311.1 hypothetical protein ABL78_0538 [Leptomonas seymouri]